VLESLIRLENESAAAAEAFFGGMRLSSSFAKAISHPAGVVSPTLI
jgi:hypothetical protein